ncbi:hypothetical protein JVT61DRAFT_6111 [Boletus reticuloceps]|uniref:Uncharacterized protein n=1 Tax=Boletus reticuloceps TaxID=495285 RepID=A0A8I2YLG5_9AGAM|nr:hypothetical protein JVT61DRAFT_6111 [Boletus reticuloceps]
MFFSLNYLCALARADHLYFQDPRTIYDPYLFTAHSRSSQALISIPQYTHDLDDLSISDDPTPIYSPSHRLLAFTAKPPRSDSLEPRTHIRTSSTQFGISQADLGSAAIKVGGTVLSGMKSLGGMAYNAAAEYARSRPGMSAVTPASEDPTRRLLSTQGDQRLPQ